jgi:hypothetical protein
MPSILSVCLSTGHTITSGATSTFKSLPGLTGTCSYEPGESRSSLFGGNSNWRGPVWMPVNFLMIESLQKFAMFYKDTLRVPLRVCVLMLYPILRVTDRLAPVTVW